MALTGCGGKLRMTGQKMCESEGGTYNVQMKHCTYSNQPRSAKQSCQAKGGYYDEAADVCEIGVDRELSGPPAAFRLWRRRPPARPSSRMGAALVKIYWPSGADHSSPTSSPSLPRIGLLRPLLLLAGVALIGYLIHRIGPAAILSAFQSLSWRLVLVLVFPTCLVAITDTVAWRFTFLKPPRSFARLFESAGRGSGEHGHTDRLGGGTSLKAYLLRPGVPLREGLASVIADKTASVVAQVLGLLGGLVVIILLLPESSALLFAQGGPWSSRSCA